MSILRVYDPSECDAAGVPLDWERCRLCRPTRELVGDWPSCGMCGGHGALKAAALAAKLARLGRVAATETGRVWVPAQDPLKPRCESCSHPMSEGTWEHMRVPVAVAPAVMKASVARATQALRGGDEPNPEATTHYSPCDEGCRHGGPLRCNTPSDLTAEWDTHLLAADSDVLRSIVGAGVTVEASWCSVDVRTLGWPHDLRTEKLAVLCLRCFAAKTAESKPSGEGTHA
jgi:hypothetical protein